MAQGNGKIANLPRGIREQLNWRINDDDEPGAKIVEWLNSKPEVQAVMKEHYDGRPISEQNLSEWRKYGYQKWLALHTILDESRSLSDDSEEFAATGVNCEKLLLALTASYAEMVQRWNIIPPDQLIYKMGVFKNLTNAILTLRRAEIQAVRLEFERERLALLREKTRNKSAASASTRKSSSDESAAKSEPAHSASGAPSGNPMPSVRPAHTPPPAPPQPPATSNPAPATAAVPANGCSSEPDAPAPALPPFGPRTSTPRNPRGLL